MTALGTLLRFLHKRYLHQITCQFSSQFAGTVRGLQPGAHPSVALYPAVAAETQPGQLIAVPAWFSNLLVVIGCAWAYSRIPNKRRSDVVWLPVAFALSTGFFAADMALFQPRYLVLFPRMLHPHLWW